jgi:hypothetical protein
MLPESEDPFHYLLAQKIMPSSGSNKTAKNIRLNLDKLPADFFPKQLPRKLDSLSQRQSAKESHEDN